MVEQVSSVKNLQQQFPDRCQKYGVCPKIHNSILSMCIRAERDELSEAEVQALSTEYVERLGRLCVDGQDIGPGDRPICGMVHGKSYGSD